MILSLADFADKADIDGENLRNPQDLRENKTTCYVK
jgi:hypothetical protein